METEKKFKITPVFSNLELSAVTWWENLEKFIKIYLWGFLYALIPVFIVIGSFVLFTISNIKNNFILRIGLASIALLAVLLVLYYSIRTIIAIFILIKDNYQGSALEVFKKSRTYFWSYLWVKVLTALLLLASFLAPTLVGLSIFYLFHGLSLFFMVGFYILGFVFLMIISIYYILAIYTYFFEGKRGYQALQESWHLTKGKWWAMFGRLFSIIFLFFIVQIILYSPMVFLSDSMVLKMIWKLISNVINYLITPFVIIFFYQVYRDLVAGKEGRDSSQKSSSIQKSNFLSE